LASLVETLTKTGFLLLTAHYWTIEITLGVVVLDIEVSGVDPANKFKGAISVIFGSQVS